MAQPRVLPISEQDKTRDDLTPQRKRMIRAAFEEIEQAQQDLQLKIRTMKEKMNSVDFYHS